LSSSQIALQAACVNEEIGRAHLAVKQLRPESGMRDELGEENAQVPCQILL
jgi:hypothetical protein